MRRQGGFTLIELMVVIAILGILGATAIPVYRTWLQRAYGSEAAIMMKQLLDAEIGYFLEHNKFYPDNETYDIAPNGNINPAGVDVLKLIKENLNIDIPVGHPLGYSFAGVNEPNNEFFTLTVYSTGFTLFQGSDSDTVIATVDKTGKTQYLYPSY